MSHALFTLRRIHPAGSRRRCVVLARRAFHFQNEFDSLDTVAIADCIRSRNIISNLFAQATHMAVALLAAVNVGCERTRQALRHQQQHRLASCVCFAYSGFLGVPVQPYSAPWPSCPVTLILISRGHRYGIETRIICVLEVFETVAPRYTLQCTLMAIPAIIGNRQDSVPAILPVQAANIHIAYTACI